MNDTIFPIFLAEFLIKSAIILAIGFGLLMLLRRFSPAAKHSIWLRIFAGCLAVPVILLALPRWQILPAINNQSATGVASISGQTDLPSRAESIRTITGETPAIPVETFSIDWTILLSAVWITGSCLILLQLLLSRVYLRKMEHSARPAAARFQELFDRIAASHSLKRPVRLLTSPRVKTPFTWGTRHPVIVLPEEVDQWPTQDLQMILLHEACHISRNDAAAVLVSRIFLALQWVNPIAWLAVRQAVQFREEDCDRRVLQQGHSAPVYADMLFRQAKIVSTYPYASCATAVAETGTIEQRIKMILHPNTANRLSPIFNKLTGTALGAAVFAIAMAGGHTPDATAEADPFGGAAAKAGKKGDSKSLEAKLKTMILPSVEFIDTPITAAVEFLQHRSVELDSGGKGINIIVSPGLSEDTLITLKLTDVPLGEALKYTAGLAQGGLRIDEDAVVLVPAEEATTSTGNGKDVPAAKAIKAKLDRIQLASIEFSGTPFTDALGFLRAKSADLDKSEKDANKQGINIVLNGGEGADPGDKRITLKLSNVSLATALRYTCEQAGYEYAVEAGAVVITPASKKAE